MPAPCDNSRHCECSEAIWGECSEAKGAARLGRPGSGSPEGAALWQGSGGVRGASPIWGGVPPVGKGRPEGIAPSGRRFGGCPSRALLIFPLPTRKGAGGWFLTTYGISSSLPMLSRPWSARCASAACDSGYSVVRTSSTPLWAQSRTSLALSNHCSRVPVKWPIPVRVT